MKALKYVFGAVGIVSFLTVLIWVGYNVYHLHKTLDDTEKEFVELDQADADRLNTFIDAGITVYVDGVPVNRVTAEIVDAAESVRIGDTEYGIEPLLDEGYAMLVNGVLEPAEGATMDSILAYYYPYEIKIEDKIIVLKEK